MIPVSFDYIVAKNLEEALGLLAADPDNTKLLAGGHSLVPAMKLRLAQPGKLVDISRIKELAYIREEGGEVRIGAMTTHRAIEDSALLQKLCPVMPQCAGEIGDMQVRNRGTIGGSIAHADPAADWPAAVLASGASIVLVGKKGERTVAAEEFFLDLFTTALQSGEIVRELRIPKAKAGTGQSYYKVRHPASGFAVVGAAVSLETSGGKCSAARIGITGMASHAFRAKAAEAALTGKMLDDAAIRAASAKAHEGMEAAADHFASAEFRRHLATVAVQRALTAAAGMAK